MAVLQGLECRVEGGGFMDRRQGAGCKVQCSVCRVQASGFRVLGLGFRDSGLGIRGLEFRVCLEWGWCRVPGVYAVDTKGIRGAYAVGMSSRSFTTTFVTFSNLVWVVRFGIRSLGSRVKSSGWKISITLKV